MLGEKKYYVRDIKEFIIFIMMKLSECISSIYINLSKNLFLLKNKFNTFDGQDA